MPAPYRAGHVAVIGRPNVGKSTLVNALVGVKVSIVSPKAQTTRHRLLGIATFEHGQLLLVDTPGIHAKQSRAMNRYMNRAARGALTDVDAAVLVIEAGRWTDEDGLAYAALRDAGVPCVLVINKVDRLKDKTALLPFIAEHTREREFAAVHPLSALKGKGLRELADTLIGLMPESPPLYGEDEITDRSERFLAAELVREQLMLRLGEEVPYSTTVEIESFEEDGELLRIAAVIWVERAGQKPIVIGEGGRRLKAIGTGAREGMQKLFGRKVFLKLWCKVREGWSDDESALRQFGYAE
ncbi:GTPase Era [Rehaibacterium terrae]|jgi:GTP-binding protein Era|uniref:GTPase Era n=1 Tax=Rehaibacterium terrae TaxID=1341696 RepID=A0A7W7Y0E6_9GAMM|nr:GTPase Era [Rehaibacterium terrae]MBB5015772.1 GTP-binding protein Era [Rehaibacterium terrae]